MSENWGVLEPEQAEPVGDDALPVVIAWVLMSAVVGMGLSLTKRLTQGDESGIILILFSVVVGGSLGFVVHHVERFVSFRLAVRLIDQRGQAFVPRHPAVFVLPALIAVPGLLWLGVVGALHTHSLLAAQAFLVSTIIVGFGLWRTWCNHRLTLALQFLMSGKEAEGRRVLLGLASRALIPLRVKEVAMLNLAQLSLRGADLKQALAYFEGIQRPKSRAPALVGSALVHALMGKYGAAERRLRDLTNLPGARYYQEQVDEVRLLIRLRRDGEEEAFELGERLSSPANGDLFRGLMLVVVLRLQRDLHVLDWAEDDLTERLKASGMLDIIPELKELPE